MGPTLILSSNNAANGNLSVDLSQYLDLTPDSDLDVYDPGWSNKVIAHSLLREGGTLALEARQEKALTFPLKLSAVNKPALHALVQSINQVLNSAGATHSWRDADASQATVFDSITGELAIKYHYRRAERFWLEADLKLYTQPLGRTAGPRALAAASGVGPLLMITPYASGGALAIGASTQAGVAGYGGAPMGASSGVFYPGSPSLAGDAPALLQISYLGPLPPSTGSPIPYAAVSVLPGASYRPPPDERTVVHRRPIRRLDADHELGIIDRRPIPSLLRQPDIGAVLAVLRPPDAARHHACGRPPPVCDRAQRRWHKHHPDRVIECTDCRDGDHPPSDWGLYDLGTLHVRASQTLAHNPGFYAAGPGTGVGGTQACDLAAVITLPEAATWYLNPGGGAHNAFGPFFNPGQATNGLVLDDVAGQQYSVRPNASPVGAPSPAALASYLEPITPYSRGLVPRPDPKNGLPVIAILGMGVGTSTNLLNQQTSAQVTVLERARYMLS